MDILWEYTCIQFNGATLVKGVVLKDLPYDYKHGKSNWSHFLKMLRSYATKPAKHKRLKLFAKNTDYEVNTDKRGSFKLFMNNNFDEVVKVIDAETNKPLDFVNSYQTNFKETSSKVAVITDLDDTVISSHSASLIKRVLTVAFKAPTNRKSIAYTSNLLKHLADKGSPIFYLSKSESNLFGMIARILEDQKLPIGPVTLTPFLNFRQLFDPKKGADYKKKNIEFYLENLPQSKFILFGDDSQRDISIYADIVSNYPDRIEKVYIRKTRSELNASRLEAWQRIKKSPIPLMYYESDDNTESERIEIDKLFSE